MPSHHVHNVIEQSPSAAAAAQSAVASPNTGGQERSLYITFFCLTTTFFICHMPRVLLNINEFYMNQQRELCRTRYHRRYTEPDWVIIASAVEQLLLITNSSINFVYYCLVGKTFRNHMCRSLFWWCGSCIKLVTGVDVTTTAGTGETLVADLESRSRSCQSTIRRGGRNVSVDFVSMDDIKADFRRSRHFSFDTSSAVDLAMQLSSNLEPPSPANNALSAGDTSPSRVKLNSIGRLNSGGRNICEPLIECSEGSGRSSFSASVNSDDVFDGSRNEEDEDYSSNDDDDSFSRCSVCDGDVTLIRENRVSVGSSSRSSCQMCCQKRDEKALAPPPQAGESFEELRKKSAIGNTLSTETLGVYDITIKIKPEDEDTETAVVKKEETKMSSSVSTILCATNAAAAAISKQLAKYAVPGRSRSPVFV
jgi:hypothetical protein